MTNENQLTTKRIPYAISDYKRMRVENGYYVDKTHYIPQRLDVWLYAKQSVRGKDEGMRG